MQEGFELTTPEAAFVLGRPANDVKRAIDRGVVEAHRVVQGRTAHRYLGLADLIYLKASERLADKLTPDARGDLYIRLRDRLGAMGQGGTWSPQERLDFWKSAAGRLRDTSFMGDLPKRIELGWASVDIEPDLVAVSDRLLLLAEVKGETERNAAGEPLIPGTAIEAYRAAALLEGGASTEEVLHEHPDLTPERVEWVRAYAATHPKRGRPFPSKGLKRSIRDLGLEALDEVLCPRDARTASGGGDGE